jgi:hypothetical protein
MFDFEGTSRSAKEMGTLNTPNKVASQREKRKRDMHISIYWRICSPLTGCFRSPFPSIGN